MPRDADMHEVEMPAGGHIQLRDEKEVELWGNLAERYRRDYRLNKVNDLMALGNVLLQSLTAYRAQRVLSGWVPDIDEDGLVTGYKQAEPSQRQVADAQETIQKASKEIREIEKAMGIDAKTRAASGSQTIPDYIARLKRFGREYGIHISRRVHAYEEFVGELKWRVRLEQNGDPEDKAYHDCTPEGILKWVREELDKLEQVDIDFAQERGKLVVGKL